jgi:hypothetical protein
VVEQVATAKLAPVVVILLRLAAMYMAAPEVQILTLETQPVLMPAALAEPDQRQVPTVALAIIPAKPHNHTILDTCQVLQVPV